MKLRITGRVNGKEYNKKELNPRQAIELFGLRLDLSRNIIFEVGSRLTHKHKFGTQKARGVRVLPYCRGVYQGEVIEVECFDRERSVPGSGGTDKVLEPRRVPVMEGGSVGTFNIKSADDLIKATYFALHPYCETSPLRSNTDPVKFCYQDEAAEAAQIMGRAKRRSANLARIEGNELPPHLVKIVGEGAGIDTTVLTLVEIQARLLRISETDPARFDNLFNDANTIASGAIKRGNKVGAISFVRHGGDFSVTADSQMLDGIQQSGFTFLGKSTFPGKNEAVKALHLHLVANPQSLHVLTELIRLADITRENRVGPTHASPSSLMDSLLAPMTTPPPTPANPDPEKDTAKETGKGKAKEKEEANADAPAFSDFAAK